MNEMTRRIEAGRAELLGLEDCLKIKKIKTLVQAMLEERAKMQGQGERYFPGQYWTDVCTRFSYMMGLSEEYYGQLRIHTYFLNADNFQEYIFGTAGDFRRATLYDSLVSPLPPQYKLSAPRILGEFGHNLDGRLINWSVLEAQEHIHALYSQGVLRGLEEKKGRKLVLEVGGGFGCLACHFTKILDDTTYVIVDLPETLLFSASYLSLALPGKKLYVYDAGFLSPLEKMAGYDFILLPNFALSRLSGAKFDLAINTASFQEMTSDQLTEYLDFIRGHCDQLYSRNERVFSKSREPIDVTRELIKRFELKSVPRPCPLREKLRNVYLSLLYLVLLKGKPPRRDNFESYLCSPK